MSRARKNGIGSRPAKPWAVLLCLFTMVACGDPDPKPIKLQLINRGSCAPTNYDLSCMQSLRLQMFSGEQAFRAQCTQASFATWQQLSTAREPLFLLEGVRARDAVRLELRGYHTMIQNTPCDALEDESLMLWGSSEEVDLSDASQTTVNIFVDCRPRCDCLFMSQGSCAPELVRGVCAPLLARTCRNRSCDTGCFDEQLQCVQGVCEPLDRGLCAPCDGSGDCDSELCVHHTYSRDEYQVDEKFCADASMCPPNAGWALACPEGMACSRLGDGYFELVP